MSTIQTNAIVDASGGNTATVNGISPLANSARFARNLIINGGMQVAQRYGVASPVTAWNGYYADRWHKRTNGSATSSVDTVADAPSGFTNSYKSIIGTASANTSISVEQLIESVNTTPLHYGLSSAKTVTVSFWVKASISGTYCVAVQNPTTSTADDSTRSYLAEYTINAVNTWEYKTITITGDTTGTWNVVSVRWQISKSTSTYQGSVGWQAGEIRHTSNQTDQGATSGATFQITGVQMEIGSVATDFEHKTYAAELTACQRYYQQMVCGSDAFTFPGKGQGSTTVDGTFPLAVPLRASPTMNAITTRFFSDDGFTTSTAAPTANQFSAGNCHLGLQIASFSGGTAFANNHAGVWGPVNSTLKIDAEL